MFKSWVTSESPGSRSVILTSYCLEEQLGAVLAYSLVGTISAGRMVSMGTDWWRLGFPVLTLGKVVL